MSDQFRGTVTISAMDLRREAGKFLDLVDYRNEKFLVKRLGKPKAVIIPVREYQDYQRSKQDAKERFWKMTQELQEKFADVDRNELEREIDRAVEEVRTQRAKQ